MKFGAPVWPFRWDEPYDQAIKRISSLGFRAVELIAWTREVLDTYDREYVLALEYLTELAKGVGMEVG